MKKIILLLIVVFTISCKEKTNTKTNITSKNVENFDWLVGNWMRTNEEQGKKTYENWHKKGNNEYIGIGFTMQKKDTLSKENMQIVKTNNQWNLVVHSVGKGDDTGNVLFKMINHTANSFTCENKEIDFPNIIYYEKQGANLNAMISGGGQKIPFTFSRMNM